MKCLFCKVREANKKNTHYLTDSIIRRALNQDSSNERGQGSYFDFSTNKGTIEYNFQQVTSTINIEENLGRQATDEEIQSSKEHTEFSVNYLYCNVCENLFGEIENPFTDTVLPKFRDADLTGISEIDIDDVKTVRLFFYLQLLRSSDCHESFSLPEGLANLFREWIINHASVSYEDINAIPLAIAYLQTLDDQYFQNSVGMTSDQNPNIIIMNDFVIQCFEIGKEKGFFEFPQINHPDNYERFSNQNEDSFLVKIISDENRKLFYQELSYNQKYESIIRECGEALYKPYLEAFGIIPTKETTEYFYYHEIHSSNEPKGIKHTEENYRNKAVEFVKKNEKEIKQIIKKHNLD